MKCNQSFRQGDYVHGVCFGCALLKIFCQIITSRKNTGVMFEFIRHYHDPIPGANPRECGNYQDMNLNMANYLAEKFLKEVLYNIGEDRLNYPEG